ncbi:MAG: hypothetical protein KatS3mg030_203 [Saprospiraceae bacterium]|jgi:hypothetical protein|nr:MAG: hypothetical protein KatS3mg030_203 [Saprospiraceae bacterium]
MKKDIPQYKVEDFAVAIVPREENGVVDEEMWDVYIINLRNEPIHNVLVNSRGYGEIEGEQMKTTVLRHFFNEVGPQQAAHVEPIQTKLFEIANEYWVSFSYGDYMYDKKYVFVKGSICEENFTHIPILERRGVMIR